MRCEVTRRGGGQHAYTDLLLPSSSSLRSLVRDFDVGTSLQLYQYRLGDRQASSKSGILGDRQSRDSRTTAVYWRLKFVYHASNYTSFTLLRKTIKTLFLECYFR